jgi:phosphoadenosine phosphosulfate reductase
MNLELAALHSPSRPPGAPPARRAEGLEAEVVDLNRSLAHASAEDVIRCAHKRFGRGLVLSSSFGVDSAVMLHLVTQSVPDIRVILIDTGYLFAETYRFAEELRERFNLNLVVYGPQMTPARQEALHGQLWEQGEVGVKRYLTMNKVEPMQRALNELGVTAWLAGLRANQTEHRQGLERVGVQDGRVKIHPILDWKRDQLDAYLTEHNLPRHPLFAQGYRSIGDWHSTIPVSAEDDDRAGRFLGTKKECGLHLSAEENSSFSASGL